MMESVLRRARTSGLPRAAVVLAFAVLSSSSATHAIPMPAKLSPIGSKVGSARDNNTAPTRRRVAAASRRAQYQVTYRLAAELVAAPRPAS